MAGLTSNTRASIRTLAERTPDGRDRVIDLLRAAAILTVVVGHWTAVVIVVQDGRLTGANALGMWPPAEWLSWLLQVMPLFFLVGGYAGMASWQAARSRGRPVLGWLDDRLRRLLRPTTAFLVTLLAGATVAGSVAGPAVVATAAWLVALPLWFLAVYVAVVAATPLLAAAHARWGLRVPAVLAVAVAVSDGLRLVSGTALAGGANFLLVWLCLYVLGIAWREGSLLRRANVPAVLLAAGGALAVGSVAIGPYPVSMLGVPGEAMQNTAPPTLALLAYGVAQAGLVLLLRGPLARLARRPRVWRATAAVNATVLTVYPWHLVPVLVAAPALHLTGVLPRPEPLSPGWFALRPVWVLACAVVLVVIVLTLGRIERPAGTTAVTAPAAPRTRLRTAVAAAGVVTTCGALTLLTTAGTDHITSPVALAGTALLYAGGVAMLRLATHARTWSETDFPIRSTLRPTPGCSTGQPDDRAGGPRG